MRLINSDSEAVEVREGSSYNRFDLGAVVVIVALSFSLITIAISIWSLSDSKATRDLSDARDAAWHMAYENALVRIRDAETAGKLSERRYMDLIAYAELNGWRVEGDIEHGPTGNTRRMIGDRHGRK